MAEIKCPWCGGDDFVVQSLTRTAWLECSDCFARTPVAHYGGGSFFKQRPAAEAKAREYLERQPAKEGRYFHESVLEELAEEFEGRGAAILEKGDGETHYAMYGACVQCAEAVRKRLEELKS